MEQRPGGHSAEKEATSEIQGITDQLKSQVESKANKSFSTFQAVKYTSQVIAGMQYIIKIKVGDNEYIHVHAIRAPKEGAEPVLKDLELDKSESDKLFIDKVTDPAGEQLLAST